MRSFGDMHINQNHDYTRFTLHTWTNLTWFSLSFVRSLCLSLAPLCLPFYFPFPSTRSIHTTHTSFRKLPNVTTICSTLEIILTANDKNALVVCGGMHNLETLQIVVSERKLYDHFAIESMSFFSLLLLLNACLQYIVHEQTLLNRSVAYSTER